MPVNVAPMLQCARMKLPRILLVTNKTNIKYISDFEGTNGYLALVRDAKGKLQRGVLFTDSRYHLIAKACLPAQIKLIDITGGFGKAWTDFVQREHVRSVGLDARDVSKRFWDMLQKFSGRGVKLIDIGNALDRERMIKNKDELAHIQKAQHITDKILRELRSGLKVGQTELDIAWKIQMMAHDFGAENISFPAIVGINEHSASPHHHPTSKKLRRGDLILIDMGVQYKGYASDMTRVLFTKKPTPEQAEIYELVRRAQQAAIDGLHAGMTGETADALARDIIKEAGHGEHFGHSLGHGVGMDVHELPNLSSAYTEKLPAGAVVTVEPGVYLPGKFGVRLEDMVLVQTKGVKNLTKSPKQLKDCVISI
ncbi:hypothetical protein COV82_00950 [Candidatus Peregrinibacteria bacterium CG11_big_fil_rev_8_21_14_0_20_46_8]|nr:MAG: hypothetical protein COV82_00950 [Candidatus Peregrinibacteria bacterium CG11_big_fil_rev_8_21_14_0_20_46_8]